jgi:hypothetical protein
VLMLITLVQCSSSSAGGGGGSSSNCTANESNGGQPVVEEGCSCGEWAQSSKPAFPALCRAENVGGVSYCCRYEDRCACYRVRCGPSDVHGDCVCGGGLGIQHEVASCTDQGSLCCRTQTGYCYCSNSSACGFGSVQVSTCEPTADYRHCDYDGELVDRCE